MVAGEAVKSRVAASLAKGLVFCWSTKNRCLPGTRVPDRPSSLSMSKREAGTGTRITYLT
ncbi:hypothetical protein RAAC3_TM7C00001G0732 [Candidatus Saccharibacteria bacterium RAAC3_TM7_1]|nr:hypothetical protein RAAC3_TM7C00001G0732 [Candidatus Saccharibacteria bacterium RAAC3_TM7_1]